jgi:hypothetical protein
MLSLESLSPTDREKLAAMVRRFNITWEQQQRQDTATIASLVHVASKPPVVLPAWTSIISWNSFGQLFHQRILRKMLSMVVTESGRPVQHNLHALKLPDGQLAHLLDGASFTGGCSRSTSLTSMSTWACRICFCL